MGTNNQSITSKMSDGEEVPQQEVEAAEEVEVPANNASGSMSVLDALKGVLKISLIHDGLARGLREASKALDRRQAHMCVQRGLRGGGLQEARRRSLRRAQDPSDQGPRRQAARRVGWSLPDRPRGQRPQGRQLLLRRRQGLG